jgi:dCTP deaminase
MLLNERQIFERLTTDDPKKRLVITPIIDAKEQFQPSSFDLRLGVEFRTIKISKFEFLDILKEKKEAILEIKKYIEDYRIPHDGKFVLHPGAFVLGCTLEYIKMPVDLAGRLEGKSTWGRVGLEVHSTAGYVDPGFGGCLTFELQNSGKVPIPLYPGIRVAQICFSEIQETYIPYAKKSTASYYGRAGLIDSKYYNLKELSLLRPLHRKCCK